MNDWTIFNTLFTSFNAPFMLAINTQSMQLTQAVAIPATLAVTIYIAVIFTMDMYTGSPGNPILDLARRAGRCALILSCLGVGVYINTISNLLLVTFPNELSQAVTGSAAVGANAFDHLSGQVWVSVVQVWNNITLSSPKTWFPAVYACLYLAYSIAAVGFCFSIWLITQVGLGLTVAVGPLFVACLINPQTARFFNGWLSTIVTFIIAQVMIVTIISVLTTTVNNTLRQIVEANAATGASANDVGGQIHHLVNAGLMFTVAGILCLSIVPIARSIGGGAAAEIGGVSRWASSALAGVHSAAGSGAGAAIGKLSSGSTGGSAAMRSIAPVEKAA